MARRRPGVTPMGLGAKPYLVALASLLAGASAVHALYRPDLVRGARGRAGRRDAGRRRPTTRAPLPPSLDHPRPAPRRRVMQAAPPPFAVIFAASPVGFPIQSSAFAPAGAGRWTLDVGAVTPGWRSLKEVVLTLAAPGSLPAGAALALYVAVGGAGWEYRGAVTPTHPSDVLPLAWPDGAPGGGALLGVALEAEAETAGREGAKLASRLEFGRRVGLDLFRYIDSFAQRAGNGMAIVLPAGALDAWWAKFEAKFRRDPEFLLHKRADE